MTVLHDVDCPMTNEDPKSRTTCVCDTPGPSGERWRSEPEGGRCPECGSEIRTKWSGVMCANDNCNWWECY